MRTWSPILQTFSSSCAAYFFERRMNFLYSGCMTRRSTSTVTVLSILSLVTRPVRTRLGIAGGLLCLCLRGGLGRVSFVLTLHRLDPGDLPPSLLHPAQTFVLTRGALKPQIELFLAQLQ